MSQAMGFLMVFRASSIVAPPVAGLLFEATKRDIFLIKLIDFDSELSPKSGCNNNHGCATLWPN